MWLSIWNLKVITTKREQNSLEINLNAWRSPKLEVKQ